MVIYETESTVSSYIVAVTTQDSTKAVYVCLSLTVLKWIKLAKALLSQNNNTFSTVRTQSIIVLVRPYFLAQNKPYPTDKQYPNERRTKWKKVEQTGFVMIGKIGVTNSARKIWVICPPFRSGCCPSSFWNYYSFIIIDILRNLFWNDCPLW